MSEYTPITGELRDAVSRFDNFSGDEVVTMQGADFDRRCDAIDAVHAQLERENASLKAELDLVLREQNEERHTVGESITGELREVAAKTECANGRCEKLYRGDLDRIADRIDEEHERQLGVLYRDMSDAEWVELPKDADGVPIRVGDVMESDYIIHTEVAAVGVECFFAWSNIDRRWHQYEANQFRHHVPDTWERIIDDAEALAREWFNTDMSENEHAEGLDALVARCKALCARTKEDA